MKSLTRNKLLRKILSGALALALIVSLVPTYAFAADADETEPAAQTVGAVESENADSTADADAAESADVVDENAADISDNGETAEDAAPAENTDAAPADSEDAQLDTESTDAAEPTADAMAALAEEFSATLQTENNDSTVVDNAPYNDVKSIAPGTYKVTANLYVPAKYNTVLACNAYVSSGAFPPIQPEYENATLVVAGTGEDKTYTLTLDVASEFFTIQSLGECSNAALTDVQYKTGAFGPEGKRVTQITVSLKDLSGLYTFDNSSCYPVPLQTTWNIPLNLGVRLSETQGVIIPEQTLSAATYDDPSELMGMCGFDVDTIAKYKNDVTVTVNHSTVDLSEAKLAVSRIEAGDSRFDSVYSQLQASRIKTTTNTGLFMYDISIVDADGNPIDVSDARSITVSVGSAGAKCLGGWTAQGIAFAAAANDYTAFNYNNGELELIGSGEVTNDYSDYYFAADTVSVNMGSLPAHTVLAGVVNADASTTRFSKSGTQDGATITVNYPMNSDGTSVIPTLKFKAENLNGSCDEQVRQVIGSDKVEIVATYKVAAYYNSGARQAPALSAVDSDKKASMDYTVAVPMNISAEEAKAYLITVDQDGNATAERLSIADGENGTGVITVVKAGEAMTAMEQNNLTYKLGAALLDSSLISTVPTASISGQYSYIAVVHDNAPTVNSGLTYNGKEQVGVEEGSAYTLSGEYKATNAGKYTAVATLKVGTTWADGYEGAERKIEWSIAPKQLTAEYVSETVDAGGTPVYKVRVYGFANGENADTLDGFATPTVSCNDMTKGKHVLTPMGGNATANYTFRYVSGNLFVDCTVIHYDSQKKPFDSGAYYGSKDPVVSEEIIPAEAGTITWYNTWDNDYESHYLQTGGTIQHTGRYRYVITMNDGYVWEYNGSYYDTYSGFERIFPVQVMVKIDLEDTLYRDELPDAKDIPYTVTGMKYGETPETALDWIEPNFVINVNDNVATVTIDNPKHGDLYSDSEYPDYQALGRDYLIGNSIFDTCNITLLDPTEEKDGEKVLVADRIQREVDAINNANDGDSLTIKLADATVIPSEIISALSGKNLTVTFIGDNFNETVNPSKVTVPTANKDLVYNTKEQTGVASSAAYTLTNAAATDAGEYTATATLNAGYRWADGTTDTKEIKWSIAKADPTYTAPTGLTATAGQNLADVTLPEGFAWVDAAQSVGAAGENSFTAVYTPEDTKNYNTAEVNVTVTVSAKQNDNTDDPNAVKPGTYRVTANLYLPGEKNTQLPGVTAYMTNPNNPLGIKPDNMPEGWTFEDAAPTKPASDNATLVVKADGTRVVIMDVVNPVFTLQSITSGKNVSVLKAEKDSKTYSDMTGANSRTGRVTKLYVQLGDESGHYYFGDCVEFPTLLGVNWNVPLELGVDFASMTKLSDSTDTGLPENNGDNSSNGDNSNNGNDEVKYDAPVLASGNAAEWAYGSDAGLTFGVTGNVGALLSVTVDGTELGGSYYSVDGNNVTLIASYLNTIEMGKHTVFLNYQGGAVSCEFTTVAGTKEVEVIKLKSGTYTVTANIWFEKADSGLPMNPHLTNSSFPPKDPVSDNATLKVDEDGRALVTIPIVIQSKVMTIQKITGLNIVDSTRDADGNLTSITVDLGILEDFDTVITKLCTVQLKMGDLAMSISGFDRDHTWKAHFQVNLSGVPTVKGTHTVTIGQNGETISPKTGDTAPVLFVSVLMGSAVVCAAALTLGKKRRKQEN